MYRYFVFSYKSYSNRHLNVQDLLPASCHHITGVALSAMSKYYGLLTESEAKLSFPHGLLSDLMKRKSISGLFYNYLRTRETEAESRAFFESDILPVISSVLQGNIVYECLDTTRQHAFLEKLRNKLENGLSAYLYQERNLFSLGKNLTATGFYEFITSQVIKYLYDGKDDVFTYSTDEYEKPTPYTCGNISLLINGNNFLLRDYVLTANRTLRSMKYEIIPLSEPLEVNSHLHTVFKNEGNTRQHILTIRIYIQYEHK